MLFEYLKDLFFAPLLKRGKDPLRIKQDILLQKDTLYFDWTASGLGFMPIEERILQILPYYSNTHSESNSHAAFMSALYDEAKVKLKQFLGLDESFVLIAVGSGSTSAIKRFQELLGIYAPPKFKMRLSSQQGHFPLILIGPYEHHSNEISFKESLCETIRIPLDPVTGNADIQALENILRQNQHREIIASFNLASNVTGILAPYQTISQVIRQYGGVVAFDMSSASPYMNIPCELFDATYYSPHKLLGGIGGCGLLAISKHLIDHSLPPSFAGGGSVTYVSRTQQFYLQDHERREEAGTPPILQLLRTALAYQLRNEIGLDMIQAHKKNLSNFFYQELQKIPHIEIYGQYTEENLGTFAFNLKNKSPFDVAEELSYQYHIQTRAGCSCAGPYGHDLLQLDNLLSPPIDNPGWIRISLHYTHTIQEVKYLLEKISQIAKQP